MKFHWKSNVIADAIRALGHKVAVRGPGGDHDTDGLLVSVENGATKTPLRK